MNKVFEKIIEKFEEKHEQYINTYGIVGGNPSAFAVKECIDTVREIAEQYNNGWIPCSERLPNQDGEFTDVLITCESITDGVFVQSAEFYIASDGAPIFDALYHYERVLAWKRLPERYQTKGE